MINAPNTPSKDISRYGAYHQVSTTRYGVGASTVSTGDYKPSKCSKCKKVAAPAHVVDGTNQSLVVFCELHCRICLRFRAQQENK